MPALLLRAHLKVIRSIPSRPSNFCRKSPQRQQSSTATTSPATPSSSNPKTTTNVGNDSITAQKAEIHSVASPIARPRETAKPEVPIPVPSIVPPPPFWQRLGPLTRATQAYGRTQRARPWVTQVASTLVVYLCADFGAQWIGQSGSAEDDNGAKAVGTKHDWARTARSLIIGGAAAIPGYTW